MFTTDDERRRQRFLRQREDRRSLPAASELRLTLSPPLGWPALAAVLKAFFDAISCDYILPEASFSSGDAVFWLTPAGLGLRAPHSTSDAGRQGADPMELLLPNSAVVTATSAGPAAQTLRLCAPDPRFLQRWAPMLEERLRQAGRQLAID